MNMNEFTGSKYLSATDMLRPRLVVIENITVDFLGEAKEKKPIVYFQHVEKGMPLNKTNINILMGLFGDDSEDWIGKQVEVYTDPNVMFAGKRTPALRIREPRSQTQPRTNERGHVMAPPDAVTDDPIPDPGTRRRVPPDQQHSSL